MSTTSQYHKYQRLISDPKYASTEEGTQAIKELFSWYEEVQNELVVSFMLNDKNINNPKQALIDIIEWNIMVATDPAVNGGQVLVSKEHLDYLENVRQSYVKREVFKHYDTRLHR